MESRVVIKKRKKGLLYVYDFPIHCTHATVQSQIKYHVIPTFLFGFHFMFDLIALLYTSICLLIYYKDEESSQQRLLSSHKSSILVM